MSRSKLALTVALAVFGYSVHKKQGVLHSLEHSIVSAVVTFFISTIRDKGWGSLLSFLLKHTPGAQGKVKQEIEKAAEDAVRTLLKDNGDSLSCNVIPSKGIPKDVVLEEMAKIAKGDVKKDTVWAYTYESTTGEHEAFITRAHNLFIGANGLNATAFPSTRKFEVECVEMTSRMLHGSDSAVGSLTSGGTESILMAIKTYRDMALDLRGITEPEVILPITAHGAFPKACSYFNVTPVYVSITDDMQANVDEMRSKINSNTVLLVASACQYPHGVVDPIPQIAALAEEKGLPFHVDACIGGFILPWIEKLGPIYPIPPWDFRNSGVTSISTDIHKYGYGSKGASVLVYKNDSIRTYQYFAFTEWPGGLFASPTMTGSRGGGPMAAAWATLVSLGEDGFLEATRTVLETMRYILDGLKTIPELKVLGKPNSSIISFLSSNSELNIFAVADYMEKEKGWKIERQQKPDSLHLTVMPRHADVKEKLIDDLRDAVAYVKEHPEMANEGTCAIYGMVAKVPSKDIVKQFLIAFLAKLYTPTRA